MRSTLSPDEQETYRLVAQLWEPRRWRRTKSVAVQLGLMAPNGQELFYPGYERQAAVLLASGRLGVEVVFPPVPRSAGLLVIGGVELFGSNEASLGLRCHASPPINVSATMSPPMIAAATLVVSVA